MRKKEKESEEPERFEMAVPQEGPARMSPIGPDQLVIRQPGTLAYFTSAPPTNLDVSTPSGKIACYNLSVMQSLSVPDLNGAPVEVSAYAIFPQEEVDDETGEIRSYFRLVFACPDGKSVSTTSETIIRRMTMFLSIVGDGPWIPPLRVRFCERKSRKTGRTYHEMTLVPGGAV